MSVQIVYDFEYFQKSRHVFVQTIAELASRQQYINDLLYSSIIIKRCL